MADSSLAGDLQVSAAAPLYVDGMLGGEVEAILRKAQAPSKQVDPANRFWSSPELAPQDSHLDGIVVELARKKRINYLSLDLPHFPFHVYLHWWDDAKSVWREFNIPGSTGETNVIRIYTDGAVPPVIGAAVAYQSHQNPSHYGAGHWLHYDLDIAPVTTSKIRIEGTRGFTNLTHSVPRTTSGAVSAYSFGVRSLDFGWRVRTKQDVPLTNRDPDILTERESFTEVLDVLGSPVELKMRENRASDLLRGSQWKSEPQPVPYAVVNFYVDSRDAQGNAQVIDRFNVKPLYAGANLNLYYSSQVPTTDFVASDDPLIFPGLQLAGEADPQVQPSGVLFPDAVSYIDISNQVVQWDPTMPWWLGVEFQPQFTQADTAEHVIWDTGDMQLAWNGSVFEFTYAGGVIFQQPFSFDVNQRLHAVVAFDGVQLSMWMPEGLGVPIVPGDLTGMTCATLRLGADLGATDDVVISHGDYRLTAMVLKAEAATFYNDVDTNLVVPSGVQGFVDDPVAFLTKPEYSHDDTHSTDNALLRYLPSFVANGGTVVNPYGFVGGPGDIFAEIVWTPITRDYKLRAGMLQFHPTSAKFFKFEFSNLTPQPYDTYQPITRKVKTYSGVATTSNPQLHVQSENTSSSTGLTVNAASATGSRVQFTDTVQSTAASSADVLPTEALYGADPSVQQKLKAMGGAYRFLPWAPSTPSTRYTQTSKHIYEETDVDHSTKVAYFAGLSSLEMFRVDYTADDDTEQYVDLLDDTHNIDPDYLTSTVVQGTTNLVTNPSFENGITGHTLYTAGTATGGAIATVADGVFRTNALKVSATTLGATSSDRVGFQETFTGPDFTASVAYSIYAKKVTGNALLRLELEYYNSTPALITTDTATFTVDAKVSEARTANSGFETGTTAGWSGFGGTFTIDGTVSHTGLYCGKLVPDGVTALPRISTDLVPVNPGTTYRAMGWLRYTASTTINLNVNWYDASSAFISTSSNALAVTANTWTLLSADFTPPAGATQAQVVPTIPGTPASSQALRVDDCGLYEVFTYWQRYSATLLPPAATASVKVFWWLENGGGAAVEYRFDGYQVENLHVTDYTDGSIAGSSWNGTADASTSTRAPIDIEPWTFAGDRLITSASLQNPVRTQSKRFASRRRLRGIQFASQQTGPVQLVPDPDFVDSTMGSWKAVGDVLEMALSEDFNSTLGSALKITRSSGINTWAELRIAYPTWGDIEAASALYTTLEGDTSAVGYGGVQLRDPVEVSAAGRVYAAVRIFANSALDGPLKLQILSFNGDVLAEAEKDIVSGRIEEWYVGYTVGAAPTIPNTWASIMQRSPAPTYGSLGTGNWADMAATYITQASQLKVQVIQAGPGEDTWYVDSLAMFEDPILWEFSNDDGASWWSALDIRNNPNGVLIFPNALNPLDSDPTGLRWRVTGFRPNLSITALDIRPWYAETIFGIPRREPGVSGGPNIQPTDHYPEIEQDAMFKAWSLPIPQDWFFNYRQLLSLESPQIPTTPVTVPTLFANKYALLIPVTVEVIPPALVDLYGDPYGDPYGVNNPELGIYDNTYEPENTY